MKKIIFTLSIFGNVIADNLYSLSYNPLYLGISFGYGSTDWSQLVAKGTKDDTAMLATSALISARDHGFLYGLVLGYPHFIFELNYTSFPNTTVYFPDGNIYHVLMDLYLLCGLSPTYTILLGNL